MTPMEVEEGRSRVVITNVKPEIECGRYPVKRTAGEKVIVEADIFADGHDAVSAAVLYANKAPDRGSSLPWNCLRTTGGEGNSRSRSQGYMSTVWKRGWI